MWVAVISCVIGVACGLSAPLVSRHAKVTEAQCLQHAGIALRFVMDEVNVPNFIIRCEKR